jgi:hypothetical protein
MGLKSTILPYLAGGLTIRPTKTKFMKFGEGIAKGLDIVKDLLDKFPHYGRSLPRHRDTKFFSSRLCGQKAGLLLDFCSTLTTEYSNSKQQSGRSCTISISS